jgi:Putative DNA-binding domain
LEAAFPTVRKLVGDDFFAAMAGLFLRAHPPQSRMLMLYGAALPGWLESFPPVAHLAYLPDVARLDQAMRESYHAADSAPLAEADFQRLLAADIAGLRLRLAPSVRLVRSRWPVLSIWVANTEGGPQPTPGPEDVLILRPGFDPRPHRLPAGGGAFVQGLLQGQTLGQCLDRAGAGLDLPAVLSLLVAGGAIVGVDQ